MSMHRPSGTLHALLAMACITIGGDPLFAESRISTPWVTPTYADLADLADAAPLVLRAKIRSATEVDPKRVANPRPGWARIYVEAVTESLIAGPAAVGTKLTYVADIRRDAKGKAPKLAKREVLLFARPVEGRPGELQLLTPEAQLPWDAPTEDTLRGIIKAIYAPDAARRVTGVHEAIHVPGTLSGEGESQVFLSTKDQEPAAILVQHKPGQPDAWSVSFTEVAGAAGQPPAVNTLTWYRLACFLPAELPAGVNVSTTDADKAQAEADYRKVISDLGACPRNLGKP